MVDGHQSILGAIISGAINRTGNQAHYKFIITMPNKIIEQIGGTKKTDLKFEIDGKDLKIKKVKD